MDKTESTGVTAVRDRRELAAAERTASRRRRYSQTKKQTILKAVAEAGCNGVGSVAPVWIGRSLIHNWRRQEAVAVLGATVRFAPVSVAAGFGCVSMGRSTRRP